MRAAARGAVVRPCCSPAMAAVAALTLALKRTLAPSLNLNPNPSP